MNTYFIAYLQYVTMSTGAASAHSYIVAFEQAHVSQLLQVSYTQRGRLETFSSSVQSTTMFGWVYVDSPSGLWCKWVCSSSYLLSDFKTDQMSAWTVLTLVMYHYLEVNITLHECGQGVNVIQHISMWTRACCHDLIWMFGHFYVDCCTCRASSFYFTLESSHQTREEIWLICHVILKLKLIKTMNGVQSKASEGRDCDREIWHISKASSEIK